MYLFKFGKMKDNCQHRELLAFLENWKQTKKDCGTWYHSSVASLIQEHIPRKHYQTHGNVELHGKTVG